MNASQAAPGAPHGPEWPEVLQEAVDQELDVGAQERLDAHLEGCRICGDALARLRVIDAALKGSLMPVTLDARFEQRVFERIRASDAAPLTAAGSAARARLEQQQALLTSALQRRWWSTRHALFAKLAAALAVTITFAGAFAGAFSASAIELTTRYQELVAGAGQPLILPSLAVVAVSLGLTFGWRRSQLA